MCDRSTLTVDGNERIVWIKYQYLNCINISDVLCFFPGTHPRSLDIRQHAENTNNITTPPGSTSSSGSHHERVADPRCTAAVASCSIGGCDPSLVITASYRETREIVLSTPAGKKTLRARHASYEYRARIELKPRPQVPDGLPVPKYSAF